MKKIKFFYIFFCENHLLTGHITFKVINFAPSNKSIMANKLPSTNLEQFLRLPLQVYGGVIT